MKIELDSENILKAAAKYPQAKEVLKTLCPELFKKKPKIKIKWHDGYINLNHDNTGGACNWILYACINDDNHDDYFVLSSLYDWKIIGNKLFPTIKQHPIGSPVVIE